MKKLYGLFIAFYIFPGIVLAQEEQDTQWLTQSADGYELSVSLNKPVPKYSILEEIVWTVTLTKDGEAADGEAIAWSRTKDYYLPSKETGTAIVRNGKIELSRRLNESGFVQCIFSFRTPQSNKLSITVAAAVEPDKLLPSLAEPSDFDEYWDQQKQLQAEISSNVRYTPVNSTDANIEVFDVQADCLIGNFSAYMARPKNTPIRSLPAMVLFHGAGVYSSRLSEVIRWAKEGVCVIDFNVHGLPNGQSGAYYADLYAGELKSYYMNGMTSRDDLFFRAMLLRVLRAFDIITSQPEWDGKNLISFGRSQGGGQAIAGAALDSRVNLMCAEIPALCDHTGNLVNRVNGWPKLLGNTGIFDPEGLNIVPYFDAVNFAKRITARSYVTLGYIDLSCPPSSVYAMYNQINSEKHLLELYNSGHTQTTEGWNFVTSGVKDFLKEIKTSSSILRKCSESNIKISTVGNTVFIDNVALNSKKVFDMNGKMLLNDNSTDNQIDISNLSKGVYILTVTDNRTAKHTVKLIKL
jgi:cephalosporin-C deacetylase-like acetyl esterase